MTLLSRHISGICGYSLGFLGVGCQARVGWGKQAIF